MRALGDDIELLVRTPVAGLELDGDQVLPEIPGSGVDGEAVAVGGFYGCRGEGARGGGVAGVGFGGGGGVEDGAGAGDGGAVGEGGGGVRGGGAGDGGVAVGEGSEGGDGEGEGREEEEGERDEGLHGRGVGRECEVVAWTRGRMEKRVEGPGWQVTGKKVRNGGLSTQKTERQRASGARH